MSPLSRFSRRFSVKSIVSVAAPAYDAESSISLPIAFASNELSIPPPRYAENVEGLLHRDHVDAETATAGNMQATVLTPVLNSESDRGSASELPTKNQRGVASGAPWTVTHVFKSSTGGAGVLTLRLDSQAKSAEDLPLFIGAKNVEGMVELQSKDGNDVRSVNVTVRFC
jgi:hypothetical protein